MKKQNNLCNPNKQFHDKFQGKSQQISREGLLYLLNHKREEIEKSKSKNKPTSQRYDLKEIQNLEAQAISKGKKKFKNQINEQVKDFHSLAKSVQITPRLKLNSQTSQLKLPKIRKAQSMSSQIRRSEKILPNLLHEQKTAPNLQLKSRDKKISLLNKVQMDRIAESHLEYLNRFQKQLKKVAKKGKIWPIPHSNPQNE